MELEEAIATIKKSGLEVWPRTWDLGDPTLVVHFQNTLLWRLEKHTFKDLCWIYFRDNRWGFLGSPGTGGPMPDTIDINTADLEEAVIIALNYCLGESSVIDGWEIPLHKHPEWDETRIRKAIETARYISEDEWTQIAEDYWKKYTKLGRRKPLLEIVHCLWSPALHIQETANVLQLRRDLNVAYIVKR